MKVSELDPSRFTAIRNALTESDKIISKLNTLNDTYKNKGIALLVTGSLARREVTNSSDFDAFVVSRRGEESLAEALWNSATSTLSLHSPSASGAFGVNKFTNYEDILENIGGENDNNFKITQRMLIILESISFGDTNFYDDLKKRDR